MHSQGNVRPFPTFPSAQRHQTSSTCRFPPLVQTLLISGDVLQATHHGQKEGVYSVGFVQTGLGEIIQCTDGALLGKGRGGAGGEEM